MEGASEERVFRLGNTAKPDGKLGSQRLNFLACVLITCQTSLAPGSDRGGSSYFGVRCLMELALVSLSFLPLLPGYSSLAAKAASRLPSCSQKCSG